MPNSAFNDCKYQISIFMLKFHERFDEPIESESERLKIENGLRLKRVPLNKCNL